MLYFLENLHNLLLVSLRSPGHICLPMQQLLAFGSLMVTGTMRFSTEKKEGLFFSDCSLILPGEALQKGLGRTVVHVGTARGC